VSAWGNNSLGQCIIPAGLSNVVDVFAGGYQSYAAVMAPVIQTGPYLFRQPQNRRVMKEGNATLKVIAVGAEPMSYQWQRQGVDIPWATSASITLTNVTEDNRGLYRVRVSNLIDAVWSINANVAFIEPPGKPILPSPSNLAFGQTVGTLLSWVDGGQTDSYDVYLNGQFLCNQTNNSFAPPNLAYDTTYTWRVDARNVVGATRGDDWSFTTRVAGAGSLIYDNTTTYLGSYYQNADEFGDDIVWGGDPTARLITQFQFNCYLPTNSVGVVRAKLRLYDNSGFAQSPGVLLYESDYFTVPYGYNPVNSMTP
jgi:hypothetical protein